MTARLRLLRVILCLGLLVAPFAAGGATAPAASAATAATPAANAAFVDVSRCLTSGRSPQLDVIYLIDLSNSVADNGLDGILEEVLDNSVAELDQFIARGTAVEYSMIGFARGAQVISEWTSAAADGAAPDVSAVLASFPADSRDATDWKAGLELSLDRFAERGASCKMLVWMTDGAIYPGGTPEQVLDDLAAICQPGITETQLPTANQQFGLMQTLRAMGIVVFGVFFSNEGLDLSPADEWKTSFLQPIVEGRGTVWSSPDGAYRGGELQCAALGADGLAPPGQANGAFIRAEDPVSLAFEFMRLESSIIGGSGTPIGPDGTFDVPAGAIAFRVLVGRPDATLVDPSGAVLPASAYRVTESGGAVALDVLVGADPDRIGQWTLQSSSELASVFLFTGLTLTLDRDRTSTILSDRDNSLTGQVVRLPEFAEYPLDSQVYEQWDLTVTTEGGDDIDLSSATAELTPDGRFSVSGINPRSGTGQVNLRLSVNLGGAFDPIESSFELVVVDSSALAFPASDVVRLSTLSGPDGVAEGTLHVVGPTAGTAAQFCVRPQPLRVDDVQHGVEQVTRADGFAWTFAGQAHDIEAAVPTCFTVESGQDLDIPIEVRNPRQADGDVLFVWNVTSGMTPDDVVYDAPLSVEFDTVAEANTAVVWGVVLALLVVGLGVPLLILWLVNRVTTKFLPMENVTRAIYPVSVSRGAVPRVLDRRPATAGQPIAVRPEDFAYQPESDSSKQIDTSRGVMQARVPWFPLSSGWYEWAAPAGSRIITRPVGATKSTKAMERFTVGEVGPRVGGNWALIVPEAELVRSDGAPMAAELVVYSDMLSSVREYQARIDELISSPGLGERIDAAASAAHTASEAGSNTKSSGGSNGPVAPPQADAPSPGSGAPLPPGAPQPPGGPPPPGAPQPPGFGAPPSGQPPRTGPLAPPSGPLAPPSGPLAPPPPPA